MGPTLIHLAFFKERLIKEERVDFQFKGLATAKVNTFIYFKLYVRISKFDQNLKNF